MTINNRYEIPISLETVNTYLRKFETRQFYIPAFVAIAALFLFTEASLRNDFDIFLSASRQLFEGKNIYRETYFDGYHYYYSTLFAVLLYPLTLLPAFLAKSIWIILNLLFLFRMLHLLNPWLESIQVKAQWKNLLKLILLLFCLRLLKGNIHLGQMTIFILYLSLESVHQIRKGSSVAGSLLLALAINVKVLPIVLVPYLIYRAKWKPAALTILFLFVMAFLPGLIIGFNYNHYLFSEWWQLVNPSQSKHLMDVEETSFHGLSTVLPILLMSETPDRSTIDISRNILNLTFVQVTLIIHLSRLLLILGTLWFLRTLPFRKAPSIQHEWWELSYIFLCIPLIFPHQQHYAFLFIWPALAYLISYAYQLKRKGRYLFFLTFIFLCMNAALILGFWRNYFEHFKIVTLGAFVCLILLFISKPEKLSFEQTS